MTTHVPGPLDPSPHVLPFLVTLPSSPEVLRVIEGSGDRDLVWEVFLLPDLRLSDLSRVFLPS